MVKIERTPEDDAAALVAASGSLATRWWNRFGWRITIGVLVYVLIGGVVLLTVPDLLLANWFPHLSEKERAAFLGPAANVVLFSLGGTIALVGVGLSLSRHRQELDAAERDRIRLRDDQDREQARRDEAEIQRRIEAERALRERFVTTVSLLSDGSPVNRQAALFALGALADDWDAFGKPDEVQVCIEVLTGYLRAPRSSDMLVPPQEGQRSASTMTQRTTAREVSVKRAGYTVIHNHIRDGATPTWSDKRIDLARAHIDFRVDLEGAKISEGGAVDLEGSTIRDGGVLNLKGAAITHDGIVELYGARISNRGTVDLEGATISARGSVQLFGATINGKGSVRLQGATIVDGGSVGFGIATIDDGFVQLGAVTVDEHGVVEFGGTEVRNGGFVDLKGAKISDAADVGLGDLSLDSGGFVTRADGTRTHRIES